MRVVVADDHSLVRDSLKQYVSRLDDVTQIDDAESLYSVLDLAGTAPPVDIILLDLNMPGMRGPASVASVRERFPDTRIVIVSAVVERTVIMTALRTGANGYIPKTIAGEALVNALRLVLGGETYVPSALLDVRRVAAEAPKGKDAQTRNESQTLSVREAEVLKNVIAGDTNKVIARKLGLQDATVKVHIRNIYRKLGVAGRSDAINIVLTQGGVDAWTVSPDEMAAHKDG